MKKDVKNLRISYVGGGSHGWAWSLMRDLAMESELCGTISLYDINFQAAKENEIIGNRLSMRDEVKSRWKYESVESIDAAMKNADFVVISIMPATIDEMGSDVHAPEKYGIYQSVGDTVGAGGLLRAMRTIPMYEVIAEAIKRNCPNAWVINYTNPMTVCTRTLYRVFPKIKAFGCCHEVFGTQHLLTYVLEDIEGIKGTTRFDIKANVLGINHFTVIDKATYKNYDMTDSIKKFAEKYHATGVVMPGGGDYTKSPFHSNNRIKLDFVKRYGVLGAAGDRHLAEFMPTKMYLANPEVVDEWKFQLTTISYRKQSNRKAQTERLVSGEEQMDITVSGEEGVKQIKALCGVGEEFITNVNVPNLGQLEGAPMDSIVESNTVFGHDSLRPVFSGAQPLPLQALTNRHILNQEGIIDATLKGDLNYAYQVFTNEPSLGGLTSVQVKDLFETMVNNTKDYLQVFFK